MGSPIHLEFAIMRLTRSKSGDWLLPGDQWKSEKGQTLVEAALVLFLLIFMILAIFDFSLLFYAYQSMEYGISEAMRYGITGQQRLDPSGNNLSREASIKLVMRESNPLIVLDDGSFAFKHWSINDSTLSTGFGDPGDILQLTVTYNWKPITPLISALFTGGQIPLQVSSTMKNESYDSTPLP